MSVPQEIIGKLDRFFGPSGAALIVAWFNELDSGAVSTSTLSLTGSTTETTRAYMTGTSTHPATGLGGDLLGLYVDTTMVSSDALDTIAALQTAPQVQLAADADIVCTGLNVHSDPITRASGASGTKTVNKLVGVYIDSPTLGSNVAATTGAGLYIQKAPTGASATYSIFVVSGAASFGGGVSTSTAFAATPCGQIHTGGYPAIISTSGTELTPTTTSVYTVEIFIPCNMTITGVRVFNGSVAAGNTTVALYNADGTAIGAAALSAATAGGGATDQYQSIAFQTPYQAIGPKKYLLGFQYSAGTDRPNTHAVGTAFGIVQASSTIGVTTISPVPTAFVTATQPMASLY